MCLSFINTKIRNEHVTLSKKPSSTLLPTSPFFKNKHLFWRITRTPISISFVMWGNLAMINQNYLFHLLLQMKNQLIKIIKKTFNFKFVNLPFTKLFHAINKEKC